MSTIFDSMGIDSGIIIIENLYAADSKRLIRQKRQIFIAGVIICRNSVEICCCRCISINKTVAVI